MGEITTTIERISPDKARSYLELNVRNRPVNPSAVQHYVRQIAKGAWKVNGETIKFACNGQLIDGQHRLMAVAEAGVAIRTIVVRGLPEETFETIDTGRKRGISDVFALRGEKDATALAATCSLVYRYFTATKAQFLAFAKVYTTSQDAVKLLSEHPDIRVSLSRVLEHRSQLSNLVPISEAATFHYLFAQKDRDKADWFFDTLSTGLGVEANYPVYVLREMLAKERASAKGLRGRMNKQQRMAFLIKAWNFERKGAKVTRITYRPRGKNAEEFPDIS